MNCRNYLPLFLFTLAAAAVAAGPTREQKAETRASETEASTSGIKSSGIKIHGHWVVEVKKPDGSVADRREFENSYDGADYMARLLSGNLSNDDPAIFLSSSANGPGSLCNAGHNNQCIIFETAATGFGALEASLGDCTAPGICAAGLTQSLTPAAGSGYSAWVLTANIVSQGSGSFDTVATFINDCYVQGVAVSTYTSSYCRANVVQIANSPPPAWTLSSPFTSTILPGGPVSVTLGESITFSVTISFS